MLKNLARLFFAAWYLLGWTVHVYLGLWAPHFYQPFGGTALVPGFQELWQSLIMPNLAVFALLLAAFELAVGVLILHRGRYVRLGLALSIVFNLFLVQLGLSWPAADAWGDFLVNRLPNLLFIAGQVPLLRASFPLSLPEVLRDWRRPGKRSLRHVQ